MTMSFRPFTSGLLHQKITLSPDGTFCLPGWQSAEDVSSLAGAEIDAWCIEARPLAGGDYLAASELARAGRFRFEKDRDQFVTGRGLLRLLLSKYLETNPASINFTFGPGGKPAAEQQDHQPVQFNLSHSGGMLLLVFTRLGQIGVDIEKIHDVPNFEHVITRFFSQAEQRGFDEINFEEKLPAFFTCWTRKEAFIKARGDGLSLPLDQFDVSILPSLPAELRYTAWDPSEVSRWSLVDIPVRPGYCAALAAAR